MKIITLLAAALAFAGCSDASNTCTRQSDCFSGEYCVSGACTNEAPTTNNGDTNNSTNNVSNNLTTSGSNNGTNGSTNNTTNGSTNNVTNNPTNNATNNATNNSTNDGSYAYLKNAYPDSTCVVDVFSATCTTPDDNGSFPDYLTSGNGAGGCVSGDTANPINFTNSLEMCATELKDTYQTNLVPCDSVDFILEVFVKPKIKCDPELFNVNLVITGNGRSCADNDPTFKCEFLADGSWHAQVLIKPQNSVLSASVSIESAYENVIDFDYDLQYLTR
jgi:hypothetical protein